MLNLKGYIAAVADDTMHLYRGTLDKPGEACCKWARSGPTVKYIEPRDIKGVFMCMPCYRRAAATRF